jgi:hypothetical protein
MLLLPDANPMGDVMSGFMTKKEVKGNWIRTSLSQIGSKAMAVSSYSISRLITSSNACDGNPFPVESLTALDT